LTAGHDQDPYGFGDDTQGGGEVGEASSSDTTGDATTGATREDSGSSSSAVGSSSESSGGVTPVCGNGVIEGSEMCDGEDLGALSCAGLGFTHGEVECYPSCMGYDTAGCYICGNGKLDGPETCDGGVPPSATCANQGMTDGTLSCDETICMLDLSECTLCGDDVVEGNESCDGDQLGGESCSSIGFGGGALACADDDCTFDVSSCDGGSFLEDWETGAISGDWSFGGNANWSVTNSSPIAGSWSAQSGVITHNQQTSITIDMTFPSGGTIAFTHEESTESNYDYLRFFIDGVEQDNWSGINGAATEMYDVASGAHTFEWRYTKDFSVNTGADAVWIDDITAEGGAPV
jgi:hypothetical protein